MGHLTGRENEVFYDWQPREMSCKSCGALFKSAGRMAKWCDKCKVPEYRKKWKLAQSAKRQRDGSKDKD